MKRNDVVSKINSLSGESGHKWVVSTYNTIDPRPRGYKLQNKDPWCAATVSAVLHSQGYDEIAECSCPVMVRLAKDKGIWKEADSYRPQVGDIILFDWQDSGSGDNQGNPDHVGIVVKVNGDTMTIREGNKNNSVGNRSVKINGKYIRGFITPPYDEKAESEAKPAQKEEKKSGYVVERTYTISVRTSLNVRRGPGTNYAMVGYNNLTSDAKRHATYTGALMNGTRVTCKEVKILGNDVWMRIPSGWICAISGNNVYVK